MNKTQKYLIEYICADVVDFISKENNSPIDKAMDDFFKSKIFEILQDIESGLYTESSSYIYELFLDEQKAA